MTENTTPENGKKQKASLIGKLTMLLAVLSSAITLKGRKNPEPDKQYGNTNITQIMVASPCRLVR